MPTDHLHPHITAALDALDQERRQILARNDDVIRIAGIFAHHPSIPADGGVQSSGTIAYCLTPDNMTDLAVLLRDLRAAYPDGRYSTKQEPDESLMHYWIGPMYLRVALSRKCTFRKVGVEMMEKPVYELVCE